MREGPPDIGLEQYDEPERDVSGEVTYEPVHRFEPCPARPVEQRDQDAPAKCHLHGAGASNQLQHLVDQHRHHEDVDEIPDVHRWTPQRAVQPLHFRSSSATRTTWTIAATA